MRLSKNFLSDYIDTTKINTDELAKQLPLIGNEVEEVIKQCHINNLIIGQITSVEKHPDAEKLNVCKVNIGSDEIQIVCGAKNVSVGIKVIVALSGCILPHNIKIEKTTIRGIESNGMICALSELGLESKYENEISKNGIYILEDDCAVGSDPAESIHLKDDIINLELTSNRGDLLSVLGLSYEIGALYNLSITKPDLSYKENKRNINDELDLTVSTVNNPLYIAKKVTNLEIKESPWFIKSRLIASGIRPINNIVDISNYVMLEYGQPLHFFDSEKLGNKLNIRMALEDEECITLDNNKRILTKEDIVVTNGEDVVALAGVMGCLNSEVDKNTTSIVIESAVFNPRNIRLTAKRILTSEASKRIEKGLNTDYTVEAINRACHLLEKYASGSVLSGEVIHNKIDKCSKIIKIHYYKILRILGMNLQVEDILNVFNKLEFATTFNDGVFTVVVPNRRLDVSIEEDLIEEIGRIYGYDKMIGKLPNTEIKPGTTTQKHKYIKSIKNRLTSMGLNETITYSLINKNDIKKFSNDEFNYIEVSSPLSEDKKVLRHSLIPSLIKTYEYNNSRKNKDINIFEVSNIYYEDNTNNVEETYLSILMSDKYINNSLFSSIDVDFYVIKGVVENLLKYLKFSGRYEIISDNSISELHPYQSAKIIIDREVVGIIGKVNPKINKNIFCAELYINKLMNKKIREIKFKEITKFPSIKKDVSFIVNKDVESSILFNSIKRFGGNLLTNIEIFDVYDKIEEGKKKSIAFNLTFSNKLKTLTDEEVMEVFNNIIVNVEKNCNALLNSNNK